MQRALVPVAQEDLAAHTPLALVRHAVGKLRANDHVGHRAQQHDGVEEQKRPHPPTPHDGDEDHESHEVAEVAVGRHARGVVGRAQAKPRRDQQQRRGTHNDAAIGIREPHELVGKPEPVTVPERERAAQHHHAADDRHDDGDDPQRGLGGRARNGRFDVVHRHSSRWETGGIMPQTTRARSPSSRQGSPRLRGRPRSRRAPPRSRQPRDESGTRW